ncbi:MAG TPA: aldo/keto reductase [Clostridiaceae bacterium]|nr:aldo/keto reductase [Clostridiaceae bacterium]
MQYREFNKLGDKLSVLGFGAMRLPLNGDDPGNIKEKESIRLIRYAIDNGVNYIDTAYNYHKGKSEMIVGKALKDGYRDKVKLATKMPVWLTNAYEDFDKYLDEQLQKLDTDYIDFYLLHNLNKKYWTKLRSINVLDFVDRALQDGRIKHIGFSFHDDVSLFKTIIDSYDWDFCQIQYNYMNENFQAGTEGLEYAGSKNIPVMIMEPLLGGKLAKRPPKEIKDIWDKAAIKRTPAEWGLRWVLNHKQVAVVLSGMNTAKQVEENIKTAETALPGSLEQKELDMIKKVSEKYRSRIKVDCTGCGYCMPCPNKVWIPYNFEIYNDFYMYETDRYSTDMYRRLKTGNQAASACVECGKCETACPQGLSIMETLKKVDVILGK